MANSSFQKVKVQIPVTPNKGGTGVGFLNDKGILVGGGTGNVTAILPETSGNVLVSDGTRFVSGIASIGNETVTYEKLAGDLVDIVAISASDVDWSLGSIFTKTLTANTTLTFSNYQLDKNITLKITGDYSLALPASVILISGTYFFGNVTNYISLHCTNDTLGSEEVWAVITQN